ncbi:MAG: hypothetical protein ABI329_04735 [Candidatus Tumulicola sp.]
MTLEIRGGHQGGMEPWETTAAIRIDPAGFHEVHLTGYSGDDRTLLDASKVAGTLLERFDGASLLQLLNHVAALRDALPK